MSKEYRKAYAKAARDLEAAIAERKRIDGRILSLRKTLSVLSGLLEDDKKWRMEQNVLGILGQLGKESLTDDIATAIVQSKEPLTTTEIHREVRKFSQTINEHKNPLATINAVVKRLVKQETIEEVEKDGRKAWRPSPISLLPEITLPPVVNEGISNLKILSDLMTRKERAVKILAQTREARQKKGSE